MKTKVLITVKTYPTLSKTYDETVCTAGLRENGTWIRIYPVPFRKLDYAKRYKKYDWFEIDLIKNKNDFRPESFRPVSLESDFYKVGELDTKNGWAARKAFVLQNVYTNLTTLVEDAKSEKKVSLAVFKPKKILDFVIEETERDWDPKKIAFLNAKARQFDLFNNICETFKVVAKVPYKFSYRFYDDQDRESKMMIEDWEIGELYWKCLEICGNDEKLACEKVKEKYYTEFTQKKDLYFYLGTTKQHHNRAKQPFIIIGIFYPPKESPIKSQQLKLPL